MDVNHYLDRRPENWTDSTTNGLASMSADGDVSRYVWSLNDFRCFHAHHTFLAYPIQHQASDVDYYMNRRPQNKTFMLNTFTMEIFEASGPFRQIEGYVNSLCVYISLLNLSYLAQTLPTTWETRAVRDCNTTHGRRLLYESTSAKQDVHRAKRSELMRLSRSLYEQRLRGVRFLFILANLSNVA